jgi:hypothetical protein
LTSNSCEDCHGTFDWSPVQRVDHASVFGTCFSCHNGVTAQGKDPGHIASVNDCELCHITAAWVPAIVVRNSPLSPGGNRVQLAYSENRGGNSQVAAWSSDAHQLDYSSYHTNYCQATTDSVKTKRISRHRVSDGDS